MIKIIIFILIVAVFGIGLSAITKSGKLSYPQIITDSPNKSSETDETGGLTDTIHPLSIEYMRSQEYPGSEIVIEQTLPSGSNYDRFIASYKSDGLKIYALLTIPRSNIPPADGWPVIVFNHGFIPPAQYRTTERYVAYVDGFASNGYIVFRPDYRGHGNSEGSATGGYGTNAYTIDVLNAVASVKKLKQADGNRIGMWGHSMGGFITLRSMVVSEDIKAGVIWGGVVASYPDLISRWRRGTTTSSPFPTNTTRGGWRTGFIRDYGTPEQNPAFWNSISANSYLADISGPLQLHHGEADHSVPVEFSRILAQQLKDASKIGEVYTYPGDDHDITASFGTAMQRSIAFFDTYVKNITQ